MPKISVIIPVYNAARYLRTCLDSLCSQSYKNWEAYCVDDGSSDGSKAILDEYAAKDSRINVLSQENLGAHVARNRALDCVSGEWVTYIDADDMVSVEWFAEAVRLIGISDVDMVRLSYEFSERPSDAFYSKKGGYPHRIYRSKDAISYCWKTFFPWGFLWATFIRRSIIMDLKFKPVIRCKEDSIWLIELVPRVKAICVGSFDGYLYRRSLGSLSRGRRSYTQSIAYLSAISEIWGSQKSLAIENELNRLLQDCIAKAASSDVIEWISLCQRSELSMSNNVRKAYMVLKDIGAIIGIRSVKFRYRLVFWWWTVTGRTRGILMVNGVISVYRHIIKILKKLCYIGI